MSLEDYKDAGFRVVRGLVPPDLIEALNDRFEDLAERRVEPTHNMQIVRNVQVAKGLVEPRTPAHGISKVNFVQADPVMRQFSLCDPLLDEVEALIGADLIAMNSMYLNKPPNVDAAGLVVTPPSADNMASASSPPAGSGSHRERKWDRHHNTQQATTGSFHDW